MLTPDLVATSWPPSPMVDPGDLGFIVGYSTDGGCGVVRLAGQLDPLTRDLASRACLDGDHIDGVVDLAETAFTDCCGYVGLVTARLVLEQRGGSLSLRNQTGQPARVLALLRIAEECPTLACAS